MNWTVIYNPDLDLIKLICEGEYSLEGSIKTKQSCLADENWRPGMKILVDFRKVIFNRPEIEELRKNAKFNSDNEEAFGHGRIAYLVKSVTDYGVVRQIQTFMEMYTKHETMIFLDEDESLSWLTSKSENQ